MPIFYNVVRGENGNTHLEISDTPNNDMNVLIYESGKGGLSFTN